MKIFLKTIFNFSSLWHNEFPYDTQLRVMINCTQFHVCKLERIKGVKTNRQILRNANTHIELHFMAQTFLIILCFLFTIYLYVTKNRTRKGHFLKQLQKHTKQLQKHECALRRESNTVLTITMLSLYCCRSVHFLI